MPRIRRGRPADLPALRRIQAATLAEPLPDLLATAARGTPCLLVVETTDPVGYALVVPGESVASVPELAVHPDWQRQGLGTRLLEAVCDRLADEGYECVELTVRADDDRARAFYADCGFAERTRLPDHFSDGDGLVLERGLE